MVNLNDKLEYLLTSGTMDVQHMLDVMGEEGMYALYESNDYKKINKELLFGVYVFALANNKLHKRYRKTKQECVGVLDGLLEKQELYNLTLTRKLNVLDVGKDHYYEFLRYVIQTYVNFYKGWGVNEVIPEESTMGRKLRMVYPPQDIVNILAYLRAYYGRYSGQDEMACMLGGLFDAYNNDADVNFRVGDEKYKFNVAMVKVNVIAGIENWKGFDKIAIKQGKSVFKQFGFTDRDKAVAKLYANRK